MNEHANNRSGKRRHATDEDEVRRESRLASPAVQAARPASTTRRRSRRAEERPAPRDTPASPLPVVSSPTEGDFKVLRTDIRSDGRGRVTIGQDILGDTQYRALINEIGQIVLDPVVTIPARELWLFQNSEALTSVVRGVKQAKAGQLGTFPSFAAFADKPDDEEDVAGDEDPASGTGD